MTLEESMAKLNERQREAVEHVDGPLLVVAGPGTGKTQLLSLRAANILATCDVQPKNILCLTYTEAGARAMRKRLVELVGRDAYGIEVSTFHSFATSVKSRFPEFFHRDPTATPVSDLHAKEILDAYLKSLPFGSPLSSSFGGKAASLGGVMSFISKMKRSGLSPDDCRAIMRQNIECADYLDGNEELMGLLNSPLPRKAVEKAEYVARFEELIHAAHACAPDGLKQPAVSTVGIYEPYLVWLDGLVSRTELVDEGGKTSGFQGIRDGQFAKADDARSASVRAASENALAACGAYEHYQRTLAEEGLIDFDDMVMDCIEAVESSSELKHALQDRYRYIQVDEFQDTNGAQMRMVELLCEGVEVPNVMAVGDDDQAIMRFQGASVAYIEQFQERFRPHEVVLEVNYRSTPEIVSLGSGVADQVERRLPASASGKQIRAHRASGEQVEYSETVFPTKELEYQSLARDIRKRIGAGFVESCEDPDEAIAVIAAKHAGLRALIPFLVAESVPFDYSVKMDVFEMESMQALLAILRFVAAYSQGRGGLAESFLPEVVAAPEFGGDHPSSVAFALKARCEHGSRWMRALAESENRRLKELHDDLVRWSAEAPSAPVRELLYDMARRPLAHYRKLQEGDPYAYAEFNAGIRKLIGFAESEFGTAAKLGRTLRLADVVERLDQAARFEVKLDASIDLGAPGAVRLTTAHSSKGLEFDLVYLLDADDATWHRSRGGSGLYPGNLLVGDAKDADDARRLLFVAVTRAKSFLELYRGDGIMLRELKGEEEGADAVGSAEGEFDPLDLADAIQTDWRQSYAFDDPELVALLGERPLEHLSATSLNAFVKYEDGEPASLRFPEEKVLKLPGPPSIHLDFGSIVHSYLEDYVNRVVKAADTGPGELAAKRRAEVGRMDYRDEDVRQYVERFDRIASTFGEWAQEALTGRLETEVVLSGVAGDNVPLFGKCDLLLVDDNVRTVRVVDYKTGQTYPKGEPEPDYARQLRFYRLLVENSPEYEGYRVTSCENWYVEPEKKTGEVRDPVVSSVADAEIAELTELVNAVWHRICSAGYDTTAFEGSELKAAAVANGGKNKGEKSRALQRAYERWLVEQDK